MHTMALVELLTLFMNIIRHVNRIEPMLIIEGQNNILLISFDNILYIS